MEPRRYHHLEEKQGAALKESEDEILPTLPLDQNIFIIVILHLLQVALKLRYV